MINYQKYNPIIGGGKRDVVLDAIRVISISFVILIHAKYNNIIYTAVPMFIILSGYVILDKSIESISSFYKKRLPRILLPYMFWSPIMYIILAYMDKLEDVASAKNFCYLFVTSGVHGAYWYVFEILGLYILAPFLAKTLCKLKRNELVTLLLLLLSFYELYLFWPDAYFSQSLGGRKSIYLIYFITGYCISQCRNDIVRQKVVLVVSILLVLLSSVICIYAHDYFKSTIPFASIGLFILLLALPWNNTPIIMKRLISVISKYSYGIYFTHPLFIGIAHILIIKIGIPMELHWCFILCFTLLFNTCMIYVIDSIVLLSNCLIFRKLIY